MYDVYRVAWFFLITPPNDFFDPFVYTLSPSSSVLFVVEAFILTNTLSQRISRFPILF
ncbi:hypothetical protein BDR04DRAFT_1096987 [Suillus decipiens]|nr:hypothetical protein BDR04DRAFT_1096987 [Suillus decipiens]